MNYGFKHTKWNKDLDNKLLKEIEKGANYRQLTIRLNMSQAKITKGLKEMEFEGLIDARRVMMDAG